MVIPLNTYFNVPVKTLRDEGVLNAYLGIDTHVFVDPALLRTTKIPEFRGAADDLADYFSPIIRLIKASKRFGDMSNGAEALTAETAASSRALFPELTSIFGTVLSCPSF